MSNTLNVILIGLGKMGQKWIHTIHENENVNCVGYVESNEDLLIKVGEDYQISKDLLFSDLTTAAKNQKADFVINVTPPSIHKEVSFIALGYGLHVLSEKPLADTMESAVDILNYTNQTNLKYMISQDYRFNRGPRTILNYLINGNIGGLGAINLTFNRNPNFPPENFRLTQLDYPMIIDMSIHHFDLMRYFTKSNPTSIYTRSFNPKWSQYSGDAAHSMIIEFDNLHVNYSASWCAIGPQTHRAGIWCFDGGKGTITWDGMEDLCFYNHNSSVDNKSLPLVNMESTAQDYSLNEFISAIKNDREPECSIQDNIQSLAMVFGAAESARRKEVVFFDEIMNSIKKGSN